MKLISKVFKVKQVPQYGDILVINRESYILMNLKDGYFLANINGTSTYNGYWKSINTLLKSIVEDFKHYSKEDYVLSLEEN